MRHLIAMAILLAGSLGSPGAASSQTTAAVAAPIDNLHYSHGRLSWAGGSTRAAVGKGGVRADKKEGDGATPAGTFSLLYALYRPDRLKPPETAIPLRPLHRDDLWVDDPADPKYNTLVSLPYSAHGEHLWRDDGVYDLIIVIGYNTEPIVPGAGSAIFLHIARPSFSPTIGCVAVPRDVLLKLVSRLTPGSTITIEP